MKISTQTTYSITFSVQAFWNEEGGMGHASFGKSCNGIDEALTQLDLAQISEPKVNWIIVGDSTKQITRASK